MHKLIITTYNAKLGGVAVTVLEFDNKIQAKAIYHALDKIETFPLARTVELFLAEDMA